jgi:fumarate reductase subunit C
LSASQNALTVVLVILNLTAILGHTIYLFAIAWSSAVITVAFRMKKLPRAPNDKLRLVAVLVYPVIASYSSVAGAADAGTTGLNLLALGASELTTYISRKH